MVALTSACAPATISPTPTQPTASPSLPASRPADPTPARTPRPDDSPPPAVADADTEYPIVVPPAVAARPPLPWCGHEVVERRVTGDFLDADVRTCFLDAYGVDAPAEFVSDAVTVEGGRWRQMYRSLGDGRVEIYNDSSGDPLSARNWMRTRCEGLVPISRDPAGVFHLDGEDCGPDEMVTDGSGEVGPSADELMLIERMAAFAHDPLSDELDAVPLAADVALGLADEVLVLRDSEQLTDPSEWILGAPAFRGYAGPFSALDLLARWAEAPIPELQVTVGPHEHCAAGPVDSPADYADLRRVSVQPVRIDGCLSWWTVDLFLSADGQIRAVTMDLWEP